MRRTKVHVQHVGQFVANDVHNHHHCHQSAPPEDPTLARQCPQCGRMTWRYTPCCIHCHLDLRIWALRSHWAAACDWIGRLQGRLRIG